MDMQELYKRYEEARNEKGRWLGLYQSLYVYVMPDRDAFNVKFNYQDGGKPTTESIWDPTAQIASLERAHEMLALLMPKDRIWGRLAMDPHLFEDAQIDVLRPTVDEMNSRIMFYINQSNLARVAAASNEDLTGGTGVLWVESPSDEKPLLFRSVPAVTTYIEQTSDDMVGTCWFDIKMIGYKILKQFPEYKGKSRRTIEENPEEIYMVTYGQIEENEDKYYIYVTFPDLDPNEPIWEVERTYKQIIVYRDRVRPGESEGRGIGLDMLPIIKDLNNLVRMDRRNKSLKADPMVFYDNDSMFNPSSIKQWSGALVPRRPGGRNPLEALHMPEFPDIVPHEETMRAQIRDAFMVNPIGEMDNATKTATEISIRENRAIRKNTTNVSRLINEQPRQIYETCAKILAGRRLLTKKRNLGDIKVNKFRFDFQSPLFDIQNQEDIQNLTNNLQIKQQFFGEGAAMATINLTEANEFLTEKLNLDHKLFKTGDQIEKIMDAAGQQAQQAQQQDMPQPSTTAADVNLPQATPEQF